MFRSYYRYHSFFVIYQILCYLPDSLVFARFFVIYQILCYLPYSLFLTRFFVICQILCYLLDSLLFSGFFDIYQILCYFPDSLLFTRFFVIYQILCYLRQQVGIMHSLETVCGKSISFENFFLCFCSGSSTVTDLTLSSYHQRR